MFFLSIFLLVILLGFSAYLSCSETALFSMPSFTVKKYQRSKDLKKKQTAKLLHSPTDLLVTIMMLNVVSNILVQNVVSSLFGSLSSLFLKIGLPLILTLFLGEIIPKSLAIVHNEKIASIVTPYISFARWVLSPFRIVLTKVTSVLSRVMFFFLRREPAISPLELEHVLKDSKQKGIMEEKEVELIKGYLELQNSFVKEHSRPREEILYYNIQDPIEKLCTLMTKEECSRLPVCDGDLDHILGIVSVRRYFFYAPKINNTRDLQKILKKPFYIPESSSAASVLEQLREKQENFALIVDEYGSVSGLVTQEDLMESVIGEIIDRRDDKEKKYTRSGKDVIIASGKLELTEFENIFGIKLVSSTNAVTLAGWLMEQMEDIPKTGDKYVTDLFLFSILAAAPNRIRRVYVRKRTKGSKNTL